jgi:hypothetical protein
MDIGEERREIVVVPVEEPVEPVLEPVPSRDPVPVSEPVPAVPAKDPVGV